jgi:hypothetical protein
MLYCFYCNGSNNTFNQCYADSPTIAGFYVDQPNQSFFNAGCSTADGLKTRAEQGS